MDWEKAKIDYITNPQESYQSIADRYGVSRTQVANHSRDEGWRQLRDEYLQNVCTKTLNALANQKAAREVKIIGVADKLLNKIESAVEHCAPAVLVGNAKLVRALTGAVLDLKSIFNIRSPDDEEEQRARIDKLRKEAEREDKSDKDGVSVVIAPEMEEYCQ